MRSQYWYYKGADIIEEGEKKKEEATDRAKREENKKVGLLKVKKKEGVRRVR